MKKYNRPVAEVSKFDIADIITASGEIVAYSTLEGDNLDLYNAYTASSGSSKLENVAVFEW